MVDNSPDSSAHRRGSFIRIENLVKRFGLFTALKDITLEIAHGEFVCFLGPSGCGKTTLLRAIAGLDVQTHGRVEQAGRDISVLPVTERDFGIVFQSYALFPNLTVFSNIAYGLNSRKIGKQQVRERVEELLQLVGMPEQGASYPAQLSGGQQQRVALARAIATSPGLLLLDEPLSALDARVRSRLRREVKQLHNELGITTIMVTHDQEEALTMADRIVVMNHGCIEQVGTPGEIYGKPATIFVADFIGAMNFIEGCCIAGGKLRLGALELDCAGGTERPGQALTVAIRPEDIVVSTGEQSDGVNQLQAKVCGFEFLGAYTRVRLESEVLGGAGFSADFPAGFARSIDLVEGAALTLQFPPAALHIYPSASAESS